jgi:predicted RNase H-like HicB family nuclease
MRKPDRYRYPALIGLDDATERYYVLFPDLPGCTTTGDTEEEALQSAKEAMSLHLFGMENDGDEIPTPGSVLEIRGENDEPIVLIEVWMPSFREKMETKAVNKTVTLPNWLDKEGRSANLNYSQILQDAIMERLSISRNIVRGRKRKVSA